MTIFISSIFIILIFLFLWILLISAKNSRTNEEQYIEDNLQMLKLVQDYCKQNNKKLYIKWHPADDNSKYLNILDIALNIAMLFHNVANCIHDYAPSKNHQA